MSHNGTWDDTQVVRQADTDRHNYARMSDELIDDHLEALGSSKSEYTIQQRAFILRRLAEWLDYGLAYAATEQINAFLLDLRRRGRARNTIWTYGYHIRQFYLWACKAGFLDGDPTAELDRPARPQGIPNPVTEEELARVLAVPEPLLTAVILAAFAGLRRGEIAAARREDITAEVIRIPVGKGGRPGAVPTHPFVWDHVKARAPGPLVIGAHGHALTGHRLGVLARAAFDDIGLPQVHLHRLRHRYGALIQQLYGDLRVTQECLRHRSVATTQVYTLVTGARRAEAVTLLPVPAMGNKGHLPA